MIRPLILALRCHRGSAAKVVLLGSLTAVAMVVFLVISELSRHSADDLDAAIEEDVGETGSYAIDLSSSLGLDERSLTALVGKGLHGVPVERLQLSTVLPAVDPECPPFEAIGPQPLLVLRDASGRPVNLPFGRGLPTESELCLGGLVIPSDALYLPDAALIDTWGSGLFLDSRYEHAAALASSAPIGHRLVLVTGRSEDMRTAVVDDLKAALGDAAARQGIDVDEVVVVNRIDSGEEIRSASKGVRLVYGLISWAVLALGAIAILVSELIAVRSRTWFFGLTMAVGARRAHVVLMVVADVVLVLMVGTALAALLALALQPAASEFARDTFRVEVELLHPASVGRLLVGTLSILVAAGAVPAVLACRNDPLDVLEHTT